MSVIWMDVSTNYPKLLTTNHPIVSGVCVRSFGLFVVLIYHILDLE